MTRLWWVRHGPTHQKTFVGWRDVPADLSNRPALDRLDAALPRPALILSSDLIRSVATADALSSGRTRLPHHPYLREFNFGDWDGRHWSDVARTDPELSRAYWESPGDIAPPKGESWNAAAARVDAAVTALCDAYPDDDIVIVAHIGVILTQVQRALRQPPRVTIGQKIENLSLTRIDIAGDRRELKLVNHRP